MTDTTPCGAGDQLVERVWGGLLHSKLVGVWAIDPDGKTTFANQAMAAMLGTASEAMIGQPITAFMDDEAIALAQSYMARCRAGVTEHHEFRFRRANGEPLHTLIGTSPVFDDQGVYLGAVALVSDVTERRRAEADLAASNDRFQRLFMEIPVPTALWECRGDDFVLRAANRAATEASQGGADARLGLPLGQVLRYRPDIIADFRQCQRDKCCVHREYPYTYQVSGEERALSVTYVPLPPDRIMVHAYDVTERRRQQAEEHRRQEEFRALVHEATDLIARLDTGLRFRYVNPAIGKLLGIAPEDCLGKSLSELGLSDSLAAFLEDALAQVLATGREQSTQFDYPRPDRFLRLEARVAPQLTPEGEVASLLCVVRDVTTQYLQRQAMGAQEHRLGSLLRLMPVVAYARRPYGDRAATYISPNVADRFGYRQDQVLADGDFLTSRLHPDDRVAWESALAVAFADGEHECVYRLRLPDGKYRQVRDLMRLVQDDAGNPVEIVGCLLDAGEDQSKLSSRGSPASGE